MIIYLLNTIINPLICVDNTAIDDEEDEFEKNTEYDEKKIKEIEQKLIDNKIIHKYNDKQYNTFISTWIKIMITYKNHDNI